MKKEVEGYPMRPYGEANGGAGAACSVLLPLEQE